MDYSKAFRVIRAAFGVQQKELAELIGIGSSHLSLIEAGKRQPSLATLNRLSEALDFPASLVSLLAAEEQDLALFDQEDVKALSSALVRLLASASDDERQLPIPTP